MTDEQRAQYLAQRAAAAQRPFDYPKIPKGQVILREAIRVEDAQKAGEKRREREEKLGLPQKQAKWAAAVDAIEIKRRASEDQAKAAYDEAIAAIRDGEQRELYGLGKRPEFQEVAP